LCQSKFYISSTYAENSYNGAAEGAFLANESYISDIPPHRELLVGESVEPISFPGLHRPVLHLARDQLKGVNLKSWHTVITEMIARVGGERRGYPLPDQATRRLIHPSARTAAISPLRKTSRALRP
jgi:hypothetical protein